MAKIKIAQTKPTISAKQNMKDILRTLGLRKIGQSVIREPTGTVPGVMRTVRYLVTVEEVS